MLDLEINAFEEIHLGDEIVLRFRKRSDSNRWKMMIEGPEDLCVRRVRIPLDECDIEPIISDQPPRRVF
jgi:hypothetical protein